MKKIGNCTVYEDSDFKTFSLKNVLPGILLAIMAAALFAAFLLTAVWMDKLQQTHGDRMAAAQAVYSTIDGHL